MIQDHAIFDSCQNQSDIHECGKQSKISPAVAWKAINQNWNR